MKMLFTTTVILLILGRALSAEEEYFAAAVFENRHVHDPSSVSKDEIVSANMNLYERAAEVAAAKGIDIMVFSEYGLFLHNRTRAGLMAFTEHVPDPQHTKANPCKEAEEFKDRPILLTLSCMAQHYGIYVVANMGDKQPCESDTGTCSSTGVDGCVSQSTCPEDKAFLYNTDVAFDRKGNLIARYHKNHLYFEISNTPKPFEMVSFKTEFGVMGLIVCFDSVFKESVELVKKHGVDTMIFPTYWFDDILPLNGIEWQQSWAIANKVNFLAANVHSPKTGSLGSGIYSPKQGALVYSYSPDGKSRLLVSRVPRGEAVLSDYDVSRYVIDLEEVYEEEFEDGNEFPEHCYDQLIGPAERDEDYRCFKEQFSRYALKKLVDPKGTVELCHNDLCCSLKYSTEGIDEDYYLAVFNGTNDVKNYFKWAEEDCFVVRCDAFNGKQCAMTPSKANTVFKHIELRAAFTESAHVYPAVSKVNYRLAPSSEFSLERQGKQSVLKYSSDSETPLLKAGFMARAYERDPPFVPFHKF